MKKRKLISTILLGVIFILVANATLYIIDTQSEIEQGVLNYTYYNTTFKGVEVTHNDSLQQIQADDIWFNTNGIYGLWYMDENISTTILDSSGNGNDGSLTAGINCNIAGKLNNGCDFPGVPSNAKATVSYFAELDDDNVTACTWFKADDNEDGVLMTHAKSGGNGYTWDWGFSVVDEPYCDVGVLCTTFIFGTGTAYVIEKELQAINENQWYHMCLTLNLHNITAYMDGVKKYETVLNFTRYKNAGSSPLYLGGRGDAWDELDGMMDEAMYFNRTLSSKEISNLYYRQQGKYFGTTNATAFPTYTNTNLSIAGDTLDNITWESVSQTGDNLSMSYEIDSNTTKIFCGYTSPCSVGVVAENVTTYWNFSSNGTTSSRLYNISYDTTATASGATIDLLFAIEETPLVWNTTMTEGQDFFTYVNWTDGTNPINNSQGHCNITFIDSMISHDAINQNFTLCGTGCDYETYMENISMVTIIDGSHDTVHFKGCHSNLASKDITLNISCGVNSSQWIITADELPLCSNGRASIERNTSVCIGQDWVNVSLTYTGTNNKRKEITDLNVDREFTTHTDTYPSSVFYNTTLELWRVNHTILYYHIGTHTINTTCAHNTVPANSLTKSEDISIANSAPIITFSQVFLPSTYYAITDGVTITYEAGEWNWTWSINDLDNNLDHYNITYYNSTGDIIFNTTELTNASMLGTPNATFITEGRYNITVVAIDTEGLSATGTRYFDVGDGSYANIDSLSLTDGECNVGAVFDLNGLWSCDALIDNCTGDYNFSINTCSIDTGNLGGSYNIENGETYLANLSIVCSTIKSYTFGINVSNGAVINTTNLTKTCTAGGLDEKSCLLTGEYVNGTICSVGRGENMFEGIFMAIVLIGITGILAYFTVQFKESIPLATFFGLSTLAMGFVDFRFASMTTGAADGGTFDSAIQTNIVDSLDVQYGIWITLFKFGLMLAFVVLIMLSIRSMAGHKKRKAIRIREDKEREYSNY